MTHQTAALEGLNTALIDVLFSMTFGAIIHFHTIPGVAFDSGNVASPNISTVTGNSIFFINL
jgi:hypothetical protein